jgi:hypothetical protein
VCGSSDGVYCLKCSEIRIPPPGTLNYAQATEGCAPDGLAAGMGGKFSIFKCSFEYIANRGDALFEHRSGSAGP